MMEKSAVSETSNQDLSTESTAVAEPRGDSLERIFYYLSELDLEIGRKGKKKENSEYEERHGPVDLVDDLEDDLEEAVARL